jgi:cytoskeletal protein RodZ
MKTVGQLLKEERLKQRKTIEDVFLKTKIPEASLEALESDKFDKLPSKTFVKGFIRNYAQELNLDPEKILAVFRRDHDIETKTKVEPKDGKKAIEENFIWTPKTTIVLLFVLVLTFVGGFLFLQIRSYIFSPVLVVKAPKDNSIVRDFSVTVQGNTIADAQLSINNSVVSVDLDGNFSYKLKLLPGENIIKIKALNRWGKQTEVIRRVLVDKTD